MAESLITTDQNQRSLNRKTKKNNHVNEHMENSSLSEADAMKLKEIQALFRRMKVPFAPQAAKNSKSINRA